MSRPVVIVYDIADDTRRARVRALLAPIADRFQYSGWLIPAGQSVAADRLALAIGHVTGPGDRVRVYGSCPTCRRAARWLPDHQPHSLQSPSGWVIT